VGWTATEILGSKPPLHQDAQESGIFVIMVVAYEANNTKILRYARERFLSKNVSKLLWYFMFIVYNDNYSIQLSNVYYDNRVLEEGRLPEVTGWEI